ncbi:hypothetical protein T484DRAFT_3631608 [Baffinella frigidus]|nr:hypothetical protein T484DRAFT_3631608 [Cryptophyta sp. CCMP2293]
MQRPKSSECDPRQTLIRRALIEAFAEADTNASGFVDREELTSVLTNSGLHALPPPHDIDAIFEALDLDGDGAINVVEFCAKFEPAIERSGCTVMGGKMDLDCIMKETFDKMLAERTAVNHSSMQAGEDCREWFCNKFLAFPRMQEGDSYTGQHCRRVLDKNGICDFAEKWLARLEFEMADISASKRLHSCETDRTTSLLSECSSRTSSREDSAK